MDTSKACSVQVFLWIVSVTFPIASIAAGIDRDLQDLLKEASALMGVPTPRKASIQSASKADLVRILRHNIRTKFKPEHMLVDAWSSVALGMTKEPIDTVATALKFAQEQVAGFYDPQARKLFMADWIPKQIQYPVVIHEMTHLLQDDAKNGRNVVLKDFIDPTIGCESPLVEKLKGKSKTPKKCIPFFDAEKLLARTALVEGEAVLVMARALERKSSIQPAYSDSDRVDFFLPQLDQEIESISKKLNVPTAHVASDFFPYTHGYPLVRRLWKAGGVKLIAHAFQCPPFQTSHVMNIERTIEALWDSKTQKTRCAFEPQIDEVITRKRRDEARAQILAHMDGKRMHALETSLGTWGVDLFLKHHNVNQVQGLDSDRIFVVVAEQVDKTSQKNTHKSAGFYWDLTFRSHESALKASAAFLGLVELLKQNGKDKNSVSFVRVRDRGVVFGSTLPPQLKAIEGLSL